MTERIIKTETIDQTLRLFGELDRNMRLVEAAFAVRIHNRTTEGRDAIVVRGDDAESLERAVRVIENLIPISKIEDTITEQRVLYVIDMVRDGRDEELRALDEGCIAITSRGKPIKAKTAGQRQYVEKIKKNTIVLGVGPAGTGKTFLAVAMAVTALKSKSVSRIVLTRPAVEAGERLGYLPGDLQSKIDPYLRPLYDALFEMLGAENYPKYVEKNVIEIAPLAYMRGRTLDDAFIILDEAQNTTPEQMKMFLTRLGNNSKAVVTGDITQIDLPKQIKSGLIEAVEVLDGVEDISVHRFTDRDVVRHKLVQRIIVAYEKHHAKEVSKRDKPTARYRVKGKRE